MESKEAPLDSLEAHRQAQTCSICGTHLNYAEGYYSRTPAHYDCAVPTGTKLASQRFEDTVAPMDTPTGTLGLTPKRQQAKLGKGGPTQKLKDIIETSAKEHFDTAAVTDVKVYLPAPVWRHNRFDVRRVEGSMRVDDRPVAFGAWEPVSELIKYRRVTWNSDWPSLDMSPDYETKRTRKDPKAKP